MSLFLSVNASGPAVYGVGVAIGLAAAAAGWRWSAAHKKHCRVCRVELPPPFLDLGKQPLANSYIPGGQASRPEPVYPLRVFFCEKCHLVQQVDFTGAGEVFDDYLYFSSYSSSWVEHARRYVDMITARLGLGPQSRVIEIASNDGYLLKHFLPKKIPVLGIEPSKTVAEAAQKIGIETQVRFFGVETARDLAAKGQGADLIIGNNVLAHVPDLHDFVEGLRIALKPSGTVTMEFPHLLKLLEHSQFDTVYHEHFSYFSIEVVERVFAAHGLVIYDVEELRTHGGSLRVYARHAAHAGLSVTDAVSALKRREADAGLREAAVYRRLAENANRAKESLVSFLQRAKAAGKVVAGYGAPAKGNTLLNFCGVTPALLPFTVDLSREKQGRLLPGSRIPIYSPDKIREMKPDYLLILPWNLKDEIISQMSCMKEWDGRFVIPIPDTQAFSAEGAVMADELVSLPEALVRRRERNGRHAGTGPATKVLHISYGDNQGAGGTSVATYRLHHGLKIAGIGSTIGCRVRTVRTEETFHIPRTARELMLKKITVPLGLNGLEGVEAFHLPAYEAFRAADLLHLHSIHSGFFNYLSLPKLTDKKPAIWTIHDQWAITGHCTFSYDCERWKTGCGHCPYPNNYPKIERDNTALEWRLKRWAYNRSKLHIVVASRWFEGLVKQSILARFPVTRIPWGVDCHVFAPIGRRESQTVLGVPHGKKIILFTAASGHLRNKGADILRSAIQRFPDELKHKTALMTMGERMEDVFADCGVQTVHLGFVANDRHKAVVYSAADVLSMPTRAESFSLVTLEAMACGLPVVSSAVGPLPELVREDENGFVVPVDDIGAHTRRLAQILGDPALQQRMSRQSREIALAEYTAETMVDRYVDLYRTVIESRRKKKA